MRAKNDIFEGSTKWERVLVIALLIGAFIYLYTLFSFSESTYDLGDGIRHYLISKYSWKHPFLFLDSWGKPFFTLLSSPFSQFGIKGIIFFNTLCGVLTAFFAYLILKKIEVTIAWPVIPIVLHAPGFFPVMNSGLTEALFALMVMISVYAVIQQRLLFAAVVMSLLPFVRTEGFLLLGIFGIYFLMQRKYVETLCLAAGTVIYSIIRGICLGDFLWIITKNPYNGKAQGVYGHGTLNHFFNLYEDYLGKYLPFFAFVALVIWIGALLSKQIAHLIGQRVNGLVVYFASTLFILYFGSHVIMWWKGWANSLGLIRPMAAVLPILALLAYYGFYLCTNVIKKIKIAPYLAIALLLFLTVKKPYKMTYFPFKYNTESKVLMDAADWIKSSNFNQQFLFFGYPYLGHLLDVDVFDQKKMIELWSLKSKMDLYMNTIPDSSLAIWDSHFGPECKIALKDFEAHPEFRHVATFNSLAYEPNKDFGYFELHIYCKSKAPLKEQFKEQKIKFSMLDQSLKNAHLITTDSTISADPVITFNEKEEYGTLIAISSSDLPKHLLQIKYNTALLNKQSQAIEANIVLTVYDEQNKVIDWQGKKININNNTSNLDFTPLTCEFIVNPAWLKGNNRLEFYLWNNNKKQFYQQGLELVLEKN